MGTNYLGFKDLNVFKISYSLAKKIFNLSLHFPKEEKYSLSDQIRRSSRSIAVNIAEAWSFRAYPKSFINKLTISYGEMSETKVWLDFAKDHLYLNENDHKQLYDEYDKIGKMLYSMINHPEKFCHNNESKA
ncbi:MAG: four helix bundle protein [Candidatus Marinimicrobia bacterium]|nr:four helix bundle protein [Candidatus Neomarinimicrobiota bacterium]